MKEKQNIRKTTLQDGMNPSAVIICKAKMKLKQK